MVELLYNLLCLFLEVPSGDANDTTGANDITPALTTGANDTTVTGANVTTPAWTTSASSTTGTNHAPNANDITGAIVVACAYFLTILILVYVRIYTLRKKHKLVLKQKEENKLLVMTSKGYFVPYEPRPVVSKQVFYTPSSLFSVDSNSNRALSHSSASGTYQSPQSWTGGIDSASTVGIGSLVVSVNTKSSKLKRQCFLFRYDGIPSAKCTKYRKLLMISRCCRCVLKVVW